MSFAVVQGEAVVVHAITFDDQTVRLRLVTVSDFRVRRARAARHIFISLAKKAHQAALTVPVGLALSLATAEQLFVDALGVRISVGGRYRHGCIGWWVSVWIITIVGSSHTNAVTSRYELIIASLGANERVLTIVVGWTRAVTFGKAWSSFALCDQRLKLQSLLGSHQAVTHPSIAHSLTSIELAVLLVKRATNKTIVAVIVWCAVPLA
jgi:hypothetical protein